MKRIFKVFMMAFLVMFLTVGTIGIDKVNAGSSTDFDPTAPEAACSSDTCHFVYQDTGVRITLYRYDGKVLTKKGRTKDLLKVNSEATRSNRNVNFSRERNGRPSYNHNSAFSNTWTVQRKVGQNFNEGATSSFTNFSQMGLTCPFDSVDGDNCDGDKFRDGIYSRYGFKNDNLGDNSNIASYALSKLKADFGVNDLKASDLDKYYLVIEPTALVYDNWHPNKSNGTWYYGTVYELLKLGEKHDILGLKAYLGNTLPNAIYSSKNQEDYDTYNFVGKRSSSLVYDLAGESRLTTNNKAGKNILSQKNSAYGISVYWFGLIKPSCKDYCSGKSGDSLLSCAENFCSSQDDEVVNTETKKTCIISTEKCNYKPEKLTCNTKPLTNPKETECDANSYSNANTCITWTQAAPNGVNYTFKRECNTSNNVQFPSTLPIAVNPGLGFDYQILKSGKRTCTTTFDYKKWKLDYASSYTNEERKKQLEVLNYFQKKDFSKEDLFKYRSYDYDKEKSKVDFVEKINGKTSTTTRKIELVEPLINGDEKVTVNRNSNIKVYSYHNNKQVPSGGMNLSVVNTYSSNESLFGLDKKCLSNEDSGVIYDPIETKDKDGNVTYKCKEGDIETRDYYSSFKADLGKNNTRAVIAMPTKESNGSIFEHLNKCSYTVVEDAPSCKIVEASVEEDRNDSNKKDNEGYYIKNNPKFYLKISNKESVKSFGIAENKIDFNNELGLTLNINNKVAGQTTIIGAIKDKNGNVYTCDALAKWRCPTCDKCIIKETCNGNNCTAKLDLSDKPYWYGMKIESSNENKLRKICEDKYKNVNLSKRDKIIAINSCMGYEKVDHIDYVKDGKKKTILASVIDSHGFERTCHNSYSPSGPLSCKTKFSDNKASRLMEISNYCSENWFKDVDGYSSYNDCFEKCGDPCPKTTVEDGTLGYNKVKNYCNSYYKENGFISSDSCINFCAPGKRGGLDYYYRPINNNNPFPGNNFTLASGKLGRKPGYNWLSFDRYITEDRNDSTSVQSKNPEYVVNLTSENIKEIRNQTARWNSANKEQNAYIYYVRAKNNKNGAYKSKFIHDDDIDAGGFNSYFTVVDGKKK